MFGITAVLATARMMNGCARRRAQPAAERQAGESVVLAGEEPGYLAFAPLLAQRVIVCSQALKAIGL